MEKADAVHGVEFTAESIYRDMHAVLMELIHRTSRDAYHGPKLRRSLEQWACNGRLVFFLHTAILVTEKLT
jgi:hypothetical protein